MDVQEVTDLRLLDSQGWLLAPNETPEHLFHRKETLEKRRKDFPFSLNAASLSKAHEITESLYLFRLKDVPVFCSNKSLPPWEGAVLWTYFDEREAPYPVIQMRNNYKKGFLRFYKEEEILAHELVHAARFSFKEPFFEELFAYKTSKNFFPRLLGPLFVFRIESLLFVGLVITSFLGFIFLEWTIFLWLPFVFLSYLLVRLAALHLIVSLAKSYIERSGSKHPLAVLLRLSDKEIWQAAKIRFLLAKKEFFARF